MKMDLGILTFRCNEGNVLQGAVHNEHGLAWTDGHSIYLTPISQAKKQEHTKLGEFDRGVNSIHWSDSIVPGLCYMCVVHEKKISIWKVEGRQPKVTFKQIRKVNVQPIPQGCLWNPGGDLLCVLCPQQSSLYYSHAYSKGTQVLVQLDREKICCGCWTTDGSKLIICAGAILMVYHWCNLNKSATQYSTVYWTVPSLSGSISAVVAFCQNRLILATELPLETLCKPQDSFLLPDLISTRCSPAVLTDSGIIKPKRNYLSLTETLLNLPQNPEIVIEDCSQLHCIELYEDKDPNRLSSCKVKGLLKPDLLAFEPSSGLILVASSSQSVIQNFILIGQQLAKVNEITLNKDERPKGMTCLPKSCNHGNIGILVGKKDPSNAAFPLSSATVSMKSFMRFFHIKSGRSERTNLTHTRSVPSIPVYMDTNDNHANRNFNELDQISENVVNIDTNINNKTVNVCTTDLNYTMTEDNSNETKQPDNISKDRENQMEETVELGTDKVSLCNNSTEKILTETIDMCKIVTNIQVNGNCGDISESNRNSWLEPDTVVPPKRPIRKKKSIRKRDEFSRTSCSSQGAGEPNAKMPMEYSSDSPEISPREIFSARPYESGDQIMKAAITGYMTENGTHNAINTVCYNQIDSSRVNKQIYDIKTKVQYVDIAASYPNVSVKCGINNGCETNKAIDKDENHVNLNLTAGISKVAGLGKIGIAEVCKDDKTSEFESLEVEKAAFDSHERKFQTEIHNLCSEDFQTQKVVEDYKDFISDSCLSKGGASSVKSPHVLYGSKLSGSLESLEDIDKILKEQNEKIKKLQEQMSQLSRRVDDASCVLPTRYQSVNKVDTVQIHCHCKDDLEIRRKFILDNGRLQLEQIKKAFNVETVELLIDGDACIVGCNIDGYIPVRFQPSSTVYITGKPIQPAQQI